MYHTMQKNSEKFTFSIVFTSNKRVDITPLRCTQKYMQSFFYIILDEYIFKLINYQDLRFPRHKRETLHLNNVEENLKLKNIDIVLLV